MIISDLNHLEVVSEASSVVGGGGNKNNKYKPVKIDLKITDQSNVSVIYQEANAAAVTSKGNATATATNTATVVQVNKA